MKTIRLLALMFFEYRALLSWHERHNINIIAILAMLVLIPWILIKRDLKPYEQ